MVQVRDHLILSPDIFSTISYFVLSERILLDSEEALHLCMCWTRHPGAWLVPCRAKFNRRLSGPYTFR